jgi:DGQHR domain-containing protein
MCPTLSGLVEGNELHNCYKKRILEYDTISVKKGSEPPYLDEGWTVLKEYEKNIKIRKQKPIGRLFEDEIWCILSKMGFIEMNASNDFKIPLSDKSNINPKQIDVFARDENTALLIECKAANELTTNSFRKHILEMNGYRESVIRSINSHYGKKLKIGWVIASKNYIWNESDRSLAKDNNICIITDLEFEYYSALVNHIGPISKYQLLAEIFQDKQIPGLENKVPAIRGRIGDSRFYAFAIEPSRLLPIAFVSHRSKADQENVITYQRMLNKKRLASIRKYIVEEKGMFPNSIIINFLTGKNELRFDRVGGESDTEAQLGYLYLPNRFKSAWIIDGQHRLYGFSGTDYIDRVTIPVIAFENLDAVKQARMFVDINSKQVRVKKNLLEDLYSDLLWDSKDESERLLALTSRISSDLGKEMDSPLFRKIKSSIEVGSGDEPLTIATITDSLKRLRLIGQVTSSIFRPGPLYSLKEPRMETTRRKAKKILKEYFLEYKTGVPHNWELGSQEGGYLCTNNGIAALLIVLKELTEHIAQNLRIEPYEIETDLLISKVKEYINPVVSYFNQASYDDIMNYRRQFGAAGQKNCALAMMEQINNQFKDFNPVGLDKYISEKNSTWNDQARDLVPEIQLMISDNIISTLKKQFGTDDEEWWYEGVPEKTRVDVAQRQQKDAEHKDLEQNFDLLHYEEIINKNWSLFKETYAFKEDGQGKEKQLNWFIRLNKIRNKVAHPERGKITKEEYDFLCSVKDKILGQIKESAKKEQHWLIEEGEAQEE